MKNKKAFTLVEIIVCLVLIVLISGISIVLFRKKDKPLSESEKNILSSADVYVNTNDINNIVLEQNEEMYFKVSELIDYGLLDEQKYIEYKDKCIRMFKKEELINEYEITNSCINLSYLDVKIEGEIKEYYEEGDEFPKIKTKAILNGNVLQKIEIYVNNNLKKETNLVENEYQIQDEDKNIKVILHYKTDNGDEKVATWTNDKEYYKDKANLDVELLNVKTNGIYCTVSNLPKLKIKTNLSKNNELEHVKVLVNGVIKSPNLVDNYYEYQISDGDKNISVQLNYNKKGVSKEIRKDVNGEFKLYQNNLSLSVSGNSLVATGVKIFKKESSNGNYQTTTLTDLNNTLAVGKTKIKISDECNDKIYNITKEENGYDITGIQNASKTYFYNSSKSYEYMFKFLYVFPDGAILYEKTDKDGKKYQYLNIYNPNTEKHIEIGAIGGNSNIRIEKINDYSFKIYRRSSYTLDEIKYLKYQISEYNSNTANLTVTDYLSRYVNGIRSVTGPQCYCENNLIFTNVLTNTKLYDSIIKQSSSCWEDPDNCVDYMNSDEYSKKNTQFWNLKKVYDAAEKSENLVYNGNVIKTSYMKANSELVKYFRDTKGDVSNLLKSRLKSYLGVSSVAYVNYYDDDIFDTIKDYIWKNSGENILVIPFEITSSHDVSYAFLKYKDKYRVYVTQIS